MFGRIASFVLMVAAASSSAEAKCGLVGEVWNTTDGLIEVRAYKGKDVLTTGPYFFEGRLNDKLVWRVTGEYACSNGIVRCSVKVPMSSGDPVIVPETIVGDSEKPEYVVFADLDQTTAWFQFHSNGPLAIRADIFDIKALASLDQQYPIRLPNYLKFAGCSSGDGGYVPDPDRIEASTVPIEVPGPFNGTWATVGGSCTAEGDAVPMTIKGAQVSRYESGCTIGLATKEGRTTASDMACSGEGEEWTERIEIGKNLNRLRISQEGVDTVEFRRCPAS